MAPCLVAARAVRWRPRLAGMRQYIVSARVSAHSISINPLTLTHSRATGIPSRNEILGLGLGLGLGLQRGDEQN